MASYSSMVQHNDTEIIGRILNGDVSGYALLVDRYKDLAYTISYRILGKREDAEEAVQDAFVKAFRSLSSFRQKARFSTWFYRIVYNTAVSKKRLKRQVFQSFEEVAIPDIQADATGDEEDRQKMLEGAMQQLPEEDRIIVTLFYVDESSVDEIHEIMGLSKANVKIRLFRARKKLQELVMKSMVTIYS
jgi:RNA polymerase sigma factor (sigma-70 family)